MRHISLKSLSARLTVILIMMLESTSASAQYYLNVYEKNGTNTQYVVSNLDSVSITDVQNLPVAYEYVDLGLSVNWATFNVGATVPEGFGNNYAWGEVQDKDCYYESTYRWHNYIGNYVSSILKPEDDIASSKWGGEWRMPTKEEFQELIDDCSWQLTTINDIGGYRVTSRKDGYTDKSIFLPLAGYNSGLGRNMPWKKYGEQYMGLGFYWSSSVNIDNGEPWYLWLLWQNSNLISRWPEKYQNDSINIIHGETAFDYVKKSSGFSIRPVQESPTWISSLSIALDLESTTMCVGDVTKITATLKADNKEVDRTVFWMSDNSSIASVDANGNITAVSPGCTTIKVSFSDKTASCVVNVIEKQYTDADVARVFLNKKDLRLGSGEKDTLNVRGFASDGVEINLSNVVWESDNPSVATVNGNGIISAFKEGIAHVSASIGDISDTCTVTVSIKMADVGLYLGVMGFNKQLYTQPISILNSETKTLFDDFIDGMEMENGTLLCYSVDNALDALHGIAIPENLSTVAIVTFTDGLDEGSVKKISYNPYKTRAEYLAGIKNRIISDTVAGVPVTAYSIGLRGSDVTDVVSFQSALKQLASKDSYAMEVENIDGVNAKFEQIARNLNRSINYQTVPIVIPGPDDGARLRFTFDITKDNANSQDAASSSLYIEGTFNVEVNPLRYILSDIEYHGMDTLSGSVISGEEVDEFLKFTFEKVLTNDSTFLSKDIIKEWYLTPDSLWQKNSEFKPDQQPDIVTKSSSAIIMLVLDCSSSLDADYPKVQEKAKSFINILFSSYGVPSSDVNNHNNDNHNANSQINNNGYEYVDLGLSVLWATCNVGADKPENYGDYYAWGETETKENYTQYDWYFYKYCNRTYTSLTKYNVSSSMGPIDNSTRLEESDDVAHVKWGGGWRMPTADDYEELLNNCTWTWTRQNGVTGYLVTSKKSGYSNRSIFLPAAGYVNNKGLKDEGSNGFYWTNSIKISPGNSNYAEVISFSWSTQSYDGYNRCFGLPVRPVMANPDYYEYVDLGLSVKWATCNVGASNEEEMGDFYSWGETETKEEYETTTYKWSNGGYYNNSFNLTKYCNDSNYGYNGFTDGKTTLDLEDDVAHVKWGGNWRIPSYAECQELLEKCTWTQTVINGVNGYVVSSNVKGYENNSIFLPTRYNSSTNDYCGSYWTNNLCTDNFGSNNHSWVLHVRYPSVEHYVTNNGRMFGGFVRPVCP